jgi:hypothetical protein
MILRLGGRAELTVAMSAEFACVLIDVLLEK